MSAKESELPPRAQEILRCVVSHYILTGEPVGSRTIAKMSWEGLSPASIRNVMSDLEEAGFLVQPHTSAGRVPTDKGYRYYVDTLLPAGRLAPQDRALIDQSLRDLAGEPGSTMEAIPKLLSRLTRQVAYLLAPPPADAVLKHIEFVRLHPKRVLVVFVDRNEVVSHRLLDTDEDYDAQVLEKAGRYLVAEFAGRALGEIRRRLVGLMAEEKARFDTLMRDAVALGTRYFDAEAGARRIVVEGTTNIIHHPELADVEIMRGLFATFEEKHRLVTLLDRYLDADRSRIVIGSEAGDLASGRLSLVASPYQAGEGGTGWIGVLGPTRMDYDRALALVEYISRLFSTLLRRPIP
ncbi:MAG TPA: heat-inducible transcriptional repressor HrcA [Candidatus Polarisedimenticolia bacterium]|nr:heat-inducible transcriptional repressor HrcA [Candidatus Polarisedimenticolia bacterium]